jgi:hypothetical protein
MRDSVEFERELHTLLAAGKKIEAIKRYKAQTGASLMVAKNAVEDLVRSGSLPASMAGPAPGDDALTAEVRSPKS